VLSSIKMDKYYKYFWVNIRYINIPNSENSPDLVTLVPR
jgi:hypothetical protein